MIMPMPRSPILLTLVLSLALPLASDAKAKTRPRRISAKTLVALIRAARSPKATIARVARRIDRRLKKPAALPFSKENTDELYPALSTPWDLPKAEWPHRAVLRWQVKIFGKAAELRLMAPLAALEATTREGLATSPSQNIVLMLHVKERKAPMPLRKIERLLKRLRLSAFSSGELGRCQRARQWCYRRSYALPTKRGQRAGLLLLSMGKEGAEAGGLKVITKPLN